jgi:hypothetical protein
MNQSLTQLAQALREELESIPQEMRQDNVNRQALICFLANAVRQMGLTPVPAWKPPKSTRESIDLVGVDPDSSPPQVKVAFAVDPLVELPKIRALEWVECPDKVVVSFSQRADKVQQSTFFLTPETKHINLFE